MNEEELTEEELEDEKTYEEIVLNSELYVITYCKEMGLVTRYINTLLHKTVKTLEEAKKEIEYLKETLIRDEKCKIVDVYAIDEDGYFIPVENKYLK